MTVAYTSHAARATHSAYPTRTVQPAMAEIEHRIADALSEPAVYRYLNSRSGYYTLPEFALLMKKLRLARPLSSTETAQLFDAYDTDRTGQISILDFKYDILALSRAADVGVTQIDVKPLAAKLAVALGRSTGRYDACYSPESLLRRAFYTYAPGDSSVSDHQLAFTLKEAFGVGAWLTNHELAMLAASYPHGEDGMVSVDWFVSHILSYSKELHAGAESLSARSVNRAARYEWYQPPSPVDLAAATTQHVKLAPGGGGEAASVGFRNAAAEQAAAAEVVSYKPASESGSTLGRHDSHVHFPEAAECHPDVMPIRAKVTQSLIQADRLGASKLGVWRILAQQDPERTGKLTKSALGYGLKECNVKLSPEEQEILFNSFDYNQSGEIFIADFVEELWPKGKVEVLGDVARIHARVAGSLCPSKYTVYRMYFELQDADHDGCVSKRQFVKALENCRVRSTPEELGRLFSSMDPGRTGKVSIREFFNSIYEK